MVIFTHPETAKLFTTSWPVDQKIHVGCECNGGRGFSGMLSNLPPGAAAALIMQGSNMVQPKTTAELNAMADNSNGKKKVKPSMN